MDKNEFNLRVDQMRKQASLGDYATAMKIADGIDWRRVPNVSLLSQVSEIYEKNREYGEAKEILLLAFERAPMGKGLLYKLTQLALKDRNVQEAEAYYKEFCDLARDDTRQYILQYQILKEKQAPASKLIYPLEQYNAREIDEEWLYELAEVYHTAGRSEACIAACDRIMLLFGTGPYVEKAARLKANGEGAELTSYQQNLINNPEVYEEQLQKVREEFAATEKAEPAPAEEQVFEVDPEIDDAMLEAVAVTAETARAAASVPETVTPAASNAEVAAPAAVSAVPAAAAAVSSAAAAAAVPTASAAPAAAAAPAASAAPAAVRKIMEDKPMLDVSIPSFVASDALLNYVDEGAKPPIQDEMDAEIEAHLRKLEEERGDAARAAEQAEAERIAAEQAEAARIAAEQAEAERIAAEKAEAERIAAEQAEAERIAAEQAEAERIAAEKAEAERIAAEQAEAERIAAEQAEAERIAAEKAEAERIAAEQAEAARIAAEQAEAQRVEEAVQAAVQAEKAKIAAEKAEAERIAAERAEAARIAAEKAEAARIAAEKAEAERVAAEQAEAARVAAEQAEAGCGVAEQTEEERLAEAARAAAQAEKERIALEKKDETYIPQSREVEELGITKVLPKIGQSRQAEQELEKTKVLPRIRKAVVTPGDYSAFIEGRTPEEGLAAAVARLKEIKAERGEARPATKIKASRLNAKGLDKSAQKIEGKDLIIEEAGDLSGDTVDQLLEMIRKEGGARTILLVDNPLQISKLRSTYPALAKAMNEAPSPIKVVGAAGKAPAKQEAKPAVKPAGKAEEKPAVKPAGKPAEKPAAKAAVKPVAKQEAKAEEKPAEEKPVKKAPERAYTEEELDIDAFARYASDYAKKIDCVITGKSMLALYERIEIMQEDGVALTRQNAEALIEEAADRAEKPPLLKKIGGIFSKKYDKDGMLILKEDDFIL